ncbi:ATP-dependent DNA helicase [Nitrosomonas supralitoralis]|uniref:DEAD/DEAH box helicase n=1 Tax=Nitrosomonas supralitoralis TaxID=2116706 RepID=A0A2P7NRL7_9PROT|nr:ATP-dependent DNA helicase [Nitrosomonas supralitoralis]PSJ16110.1 DEAD/DEAH box helicase [Nitrosomonas supralitoralis]
MTKKKRIQIAVSKFSLPSPRRGSIDLHSGYGWSTERGNEIHQKLQLKRKNENPSYTSEVYISRQFHWEEYLFEIAGRMDGVYAEPLPIIEEIKTCFNIKNLLKTLNEIGQDHPYILQLRTYGYFYWLENNTIPTLNLHLVASHNNEVINYEVQLDINSFEKWLSCRASELVAEARFRERLINLRQKTGENFKFPYQSARFEQTQLIKKIEEAFLENRPIMAQAPTGLGKTIGSLYPSLKEALSRGQQLVYLTCKNSQHQIVEDAILRLHDQGEDFRSITLAAKNKICLKKEPLCNSDYCEYANDHYTKMAYHKVLEKLNNKRKLTAQEIQKVSKLYYVCPYQVQLELIDQVEVVIGDYNYFFSSNDFFGQQLVYICKHPEKPNLIIDEAHNLPARSREYYSCSLSSYTLKKMFEEVIFLPHKLRSEFETLLNLAILTIEKYGLGNYAHRIVLDLNEFMNVENRIRDFVARFLDSGAQVRLEDVVSRLCINWSEFTNSLELAYNSQNEFFTSYHPNPETIKITCCDASKILLERYNNFKHVVAISATLKPFHYYSQLCGLHKKKPRTEEFNYPFPKANRKIILIPQVSSKYKERAKNYPRIAEAIYKIISLKNGNYIAFFPSFIFLDNVLKYCSIPPHFKILKQKPNMEPEEVNYFFSELRNTIKSHIIFAVQGGIFSEGVDYPGDMIIGAFVVGVPLPSLDIEHEGIREYYQKNFSKGYEYTYIYPAMTKAIQAAGRVIRSENDQGIILLMDDRFMQEDFINPMPKDWFNKHPQELISSSILNDIRGFWSASR